MLLYHYGHYFQRYTVGLSLYFGSLLKLSKLTKRTQIEERSGKAKPKVDCLETAPCLIKDGEKKIRNTKLLPLLGIAALLEHSCVCVEHQWHLVTAPRRSWIYMNPEGQGADGGWGYSTDLLLVMAANLVWPLAATSHLHHHIF